MITVRVPCSTSNLGPGFDSLGLALGLYLEVTLGAIPGTADAVTRTGDVHFEALPDRDDLVLRAMRARWRSRGTADRAVAGAARSEIPTARGLGSSAAAVVAGVMAADALDAVAHDPRAVLAFAAGLEGHPDNVAPAVLGGLCCGSQDDAGVHALRLGDLDGLRAVVASPDAVLATRASRAVLPATVPHRDAARNVARAVYLSHALAQGETAGIAWAFDDALHQPYRAALLPGLTDALAAAREAGAVGAALSGAGSSALALVRTDGDPHPVVRAFQMAYAAHGVAVTVRVIDVARAGAAVSRGAHGGVTA